MDLNGHHGNRPDREVPTRMESAHLARSPANGPVWPERPGQPRRIAEVGSWSPRPAAPTSAGASVRQGSVSEGVGGRACAGRIPDCRVGMALGSIDGSARAVFTVSLILVVPSSERALARALRHDQLADLVDQHKSAVVGSSDATVTSRLPGPVLATWWVGNSPVAATLFPCYAVLHEEHHTPRDAQ